MAMTEKQLIEELKAGRYKPVYLLMGDENYYIDVMSDYFENEVVDAAMRDFDQTVVYGRDTTMAAVVSDAKRYPMMSPVARQPTRLSPTKGASTRHPRCGTTRCPAG